MTEQVSPRENRSSVLEQERDIDESSTSRFRLWGEVESSEGARTLDVYDEGLERYFELSSWLAFHRDHRKDGNEEVEALEEELVELDRELSELSRDLSLSEIGRLLRDPRDDQW